MKKIGVVTPNWNGRYFIRPHYKMLHTYGRIDKMVMVQQKNPWGTYAKEHFISSISDDSEQQVKDEFPNVEIIYNTEDRHGGSTYMSALDIMQDCDVIIRLDFDMFFTKYNWDLFIDILQQSDYKNYMWDYPNRCVNYYGDWNTGVLDNTTSGNHLKPDSIAIKKGLRYHDNLQVDCHVTEEYYITDVWMHHLRGLKGIFIEDAWRKGITASSSGVYKHQLLTYSPNEKFIELPNEIKEFLKEDFPFQGIA